MFDKAFSKYDKNQKALEMEKRFGPETRKVNNALDSASLIISRLPSDMDHRSFLELVEAPGGQVIRWDLQAHQGKGYVTYENFARARAARKHLDGRLVGSSRLHVVFERRGRLPPGGGDSTAAAAAVPPMRAANRTLEINQTRIRISENGTRSFETSGFGGNSSGRRNGDNFGGEERRIGGGSGRAIGLGGRGTNLSEGGGGVRVWEQGSGMNRVGQDF